MANNNDELSETVNSMSTLEKLSKSLNEQLKQAGASISQLLSLKSAATFMISKTKAAISELKSLDSILTEISNTSDLTNKQLKDLGSSAFETASKYGRTAVDYLISIQEMYQAGFDNAEQMSELSMLAQAAGNLDASTASSYLIASNAAYDLKGSIEELGKVLDGQNHITNNAKVSMTDMAQATSKAASVAALYGVKIDELSSLIAVASSTTRASGNDIGTALKSIFVNLQDTTNSSIVNAFDAINVSMTEMVNGSEKLKTPVQLLKELSAAFENLDEGDTRRADIITSIGTKFYENTLSAILSNWTSYEQMLDLYSQGMGSAAREAEKSADNWAGSMNRLSNTWTDTIGNIAESDDMIFIINSLNNLLSVVNKITEFLGTIGSIGLGAGIFAGFKNVGRPEKLGFILF